MDSMNPVFGAVIMVLAATSLLLSVLDSRQGGPLLGILNRWVRWVLIALAAGYVMRYLGWSTRPLWALCMMAFLGWFILETGYNWLVIKAVSRSEIPLFPTFRVNTGGDEWPAHSRFLKTRDWLRKEGFRRRQSLKAELFEGVELRSSIYDSREGKIRLQVLFIPQRNGNLSACYIFTSLTGDKRRLITDNVFMPFGGFYPEAWHQVRRPLAQNPKRLHRIHQARLSRESSPIEAWPEEEEPLQDLNEQQRILEKVNTEMGFLLPRYQQEEHGKITPSGKFRVWLEIWLLNYLGRTVSTRVHS